MIRELLQNVERVAYTVLFRDIQEFERMEERFFDVDGSIGDIVGMLEDAVEFCPNNEPPTKDEILAWLWVIHPECKSEILSVANDDLRAIISDYEKASSEVIADVSMGLDELITEYIQHATIHHEASEKGDYRLANRSYDRLASLLEEIREFGDDGNGRILSLMEHEKECVRGWAAIHSLKYDELKAKSVLEELSSGEGSTAFEAEMVLKLMREGDFNAP